MRMSPADPSRIVAYFERRLVFTTLRHSESANGADSMENPLFNVRRSRVPQRVLSMLGVLLYVSHILVRWIAYMVGRLVYAGGIFGTGRNRHYDERPTSEVDTSSLSPFPRSIDVIQHDSPSKGYHDFCLPHLTA